MAEIIKIAEIDIDYSKAVEESSRLKIEIEKVQDDLKILEIQGKKNTAEYVNQSAKLKSLSQDLNTNNNYLKQVVTTQNASEGSLKQLKSQLSIVTKEWNELSKEERLNGERGRELTRIKTELTEQLKAEERATGDARRNVGNYTEANISLRQQLRLVTTQLQSMHLAGQENSDEYKELTKRAGELRDSMDSVNEQVKTLATGSNLESTLNAMTGGLQGVVGAAQTAYGAMTLFGDENEEVTKSIQKMMALQSVASGVQATFNSLKKEGALVTALYTVKTKALGVAQLFVNSAMWETVKASKALRVALISTGVGALAIGLGMLIGKLVEASDETVKLNDELENFDKINNTVSESIRRNQSVTSKLITERQKAQIDYLKSIGDESGAAQMEIDALQESLSNINDSDLLKKLSEAQKELGRSFTVEEAQKYTSELKEQQKIQKEIIQLQINAIKDPLLQKEKKEREENRKKRLEEKAELSKKNAELSLRNMEIEIEMYKLQNQTILEDEKKLTRDLINEENNRLEKIYKKEVAYLEAQNLKKNEFELQQLQLKLNYEQQTRANLKALREQNEALELERIEANYQNKLALAEGNIFAELDLQKQRLEIQRQQEVDAAKRTGADVKLINQKYAKAEIAIERQKQMAKFSMVSSFAKDVATIFGESTKAGKLAAAAATTIDTIASAIGAFRAAQNLSYPYNLIVGGVSAAAATTQGIVAVKKILAVNPESPTVPTGGNYNTSAISQSIGSTKDTEQDMSISAGILNRVGQTKYEEIRTVVVIDEVTAAQKTQNQIKTASQI